MVLWFSFRGKLDIEEANASVGVFISRLLKTWNELKITSVDQRSFFYFTLSCFSSLTGESTTALKYAFKWYYDYNRNFLRYYMSLSGSAIYHNCPFMTVQSHTSKNKKNRYWSSKHHESTGKQMTSKKNCNPNGSSESHGLNPGIVL